MAGKRVDNVGLASIQPPSSTSTNDRIMSVTAQPKLPAVKVKPVIKKTRVVDSGPKTNDDERNQRFGPGWM